MPTLLALAQKTANSKQKIEKKANVIEAAAFRAVASSEPLPGEPVNCDRWTVIRNANLAAVFDGVRTSANRADAAQRALKTIERAANQTNLGLTEEILKQWLTETDQLLAGYNQGLPGTDLQTTAALAAVTSEASQKTVIAVTVGDSRVSILKKTGEYELTTLDDRVLRLLLSAENRPAWLTQLLTDQKLEGDLVLEAEEAARTATILDQHPDPASTSPMGRFLFENRAIVTQTLGSGKVTPHLATLPVDKGDRVLLATDGIHDNLTEAEIIAVLKETPFEQTAGRLVEAAGKVSQSDSPRGKKDDITAVVLEII